MAAETDQTTQVTINPDLAEQSRFALTEGRDWYDRVSGGPIPSLYTGFAPEREQAFDMYRQGANAGLGQSIGAPALEEYQRTLAGGYLNDNPYLDEIVQRSVNAAGAAPAAQALGAGRFGSGVMANAMADAMQGTAANLYGQNYQQERNRMMQMLDRGAQVEGMQYLDANRLAGVGAEVEADRARQAAEEMRQYQAQLQQLQSLLGLLQSNPLMGESTQKSQGTTLDYGAMATGGLSALAGMSGMMPGGGAR